MEPFAWTQEWHDGVKANYGLDVRDRMAAADWWRRQCGSGDLCAPVGTILALGCALEEIERLRSLLLHVANNAEFAEDSYKDWRNWIKYTMDGGDALTSST